MYKILVLENEKAIMESIVESVGNTLHGCEIFTASSGREAMLHIENESIDLMILDIELDEKKKVLGLDYANMISCMNNNVDFIFISDNGSYESHESVKPFCFLTKPLDGDLLVRKLRNWRISRRNKKSNVSGNLKIETQSGVAIVPMDKIIYIEKVNREVLIKTVHRKYLAKDSIKSIHTKLDDRFFSTHQSFIVNINKVEKLEFQSNRSWVVKFSGMDDGALLSRYKADGFFDVFNM